MSISSSLLRNSSSYGFSLLALIPGTRAVEKLSAFFIHWGRIFVLFEVEDAGGVGYTLIGGFDCAWKEYPW